MQRRSIQFLLKMSLQRKYPRKTNDQTDRQINGDQRKRSVVTHLDTDLGFSSLLRSWLNSSTTWGRGMSKFSTKSFTFEVTLEASLVNQPAIVAQRLTYEGISFPTITLQNSFEKWLQLLFVSEYRRIYTVRSDDNYHPWRKRADWKSHLQSASVINTYSP